MSVLFMAYLIGMVGYVASDVDNLLHHSYGAFTTQDSQSRSSERKNTRRSLLNLFRASIRAPFWPVILLVWSGQILLGILMSVLFWN